MKVVFNNTFPFKGYISMTIWPWIFVRDIKAYSITIDNHECVHGEQRKELLLVFFYLWYVFEYAIRFLLCWNHKRAYRNISFEQEASFYENDLDYLRRRKHFAWLSFLNKNTR